MRRFLPLLVVLNFASPLYGQSPAEADAQGVQAYQSGRYEEAKGLFETVLATAPNNQTARNFLRLISVKLAGQEKAQRGFESVILPKVSLNDTSLRASVDFLSQAAAKASGGRVTASFVWMVPPETASEKKITLQLDNAPFTEALRYIGEMASVKFVIQEHAIEVLPADK